MLPIVPPPILISAYRQGLFPMAESRRDQDIFWVEPRERAIIPIGEFHCSRSLARTIRREVFEIRVDSDFAGTVLACAQPRATGEDTWISGRIAASYQRLHEVGHAHSLECWQGSEGEQELVGGVYGVTLGRAFFGESMFSRRDNASKIALACLVDRLNRGGFTLFDTQFLTPHLARMGGFELPRGTYRQRLQAALDRDADFRRATLPTADQLWQEITQTS